MKWPFVRRFKLDAVLTVNQVYLDEINRLNQELASELNSHRETRETKNKVIESNLNQIRGLEGFFEREFNLHKDTKKKLAEATRTYEYKLNFEQECTEKIGIELEETKAALKIAQEDLEKLDKAYLQRMDAEKKLHFNINSAILEFINDK